MILDEIQKFLPQYLSDNSKKNLCSDLKNFPDNLEKIYTSISLDEGGVLQSDILDIGKKVLIISNSCDNDINNTRQLPLAISYIPIVKLSKIEEQLRKNNANEGKIKNFIAQVKLQGITNIFYIPNLENSLDYVAFFDKTLHIKQEDLEKANYKKLATFSNYGFYIFLFKLSIHFTRIQEKIDRG